MKLIITRPRHDAEILATRLVALGHHPVCLPLLDIVARKGIKIPEQKWQAIVFTSANAVHSLGNIETVRSCPVFVVGPQSAEAARARGFERVESQGGDMLGLARHLLKILQPGRGHVLYVSGNVTSGDLPGELTKAGISTTRLIAYDAVALPATNVERALDRAEGVLLYSARSAGLWVDATQGAAKIMHYCLSRNVADHLPRSAPVKIAETPDENGMFRLLASDSEAA